MSGYSSAFDLGREVALEGIPDPGLNGTIDLGGKSGGTLALKSTSSTTACTLPNAPRGTVLFLSNDTGSTCTVSDQSNTVVAVTTKNAAIFVCVTEGSSYIWKGTLISTHT